MPTTHSVTAAPEERATKRARSGGHALAVRRLPYVAGLPRNAAVLLTAHEVAVLAGTSNEAIRRWSRAGILPPPVPGTPTNCRRWWREGILDALDRRQTLVEEAAP